MGFVFTLDLCSLFSFVRELSLICALELDQFSRGEPGRFALQQRDVFPLYLVLVCAKLICCMVHFTEETANSSVPCV